MADNIRELIEQYHSFYEVTPYYLELEERPRGNPAASREIQAGFNIDVYGIIASLEPGPVSDYVAAYTALQKLVETVLPHITNRCSIGIIPFPSTVILDGRKQPEAMLRIRITHGRGLDQPAGAPEERALKEIQEKLQDLGVRPGRSRA